MADAIQMLQIIPEPLPLVSFFSTWSSSLGTVILKGKLSFFRRMTNGPHTPTSVTFYPLFSFFFTQTTFKKKCFLTSILSDSSILSSHLDWSV